MIVEIIPYNLVIDMVALHWFHNCLDYSLQFTNILSHILHQCTHKGIWKVIKVPLTKFYYIILSCIFWSFLIPKWRWSKWPIITFPRSQEWDVDIFFSIFIYFTSVAYIPWWIFQDLTIKNLWCTYPSCSISSKTTPMRLWKVEQRAHHNLLFLRVKNGMWIFFFLYFTSRAYILPWIFQDVSTNNLWCIYIHHANISSKTTPMGSLFHSNSWDIC